ncbi:hypothetical protein [Phenylobacterium sp.]|uniref:hypothetical protein n=1 Tax=Phenylobacterium sp. TaxID=1871053 RepID=UPI0025FB78E2|nr:hypothetical protein [Phenylobacterium sp.]MBX3484356.1 hypothetical protein [Phenylobacterium sp.]MCW5760757.1 hypothetical protein [Phenylobacterium sp.]
MNADHLLETVALVTAVWCSAIAALAYGLTRARFRRTHGLIARSFSALVLPPVAASVEPEPPRRRRAR